MDETTERLLNEAREAMENAYAPYSGHAVGAALLADDGTVYTGCNVENINYTNTTHAEQAAVSNAVSDGQERDAFTAIAIVTPGDDVVPPCGLCRQTLSEVCEGDMPVYVDRGEGNPPAEYTVDGLLPESMRAELGDLD